MVVAMQDLAPHLLGLLATGILVVTLTAQTVKQWRERSTTGIARWFFLGQVSASLCFVAYSLAIHSRLFAFTNALILLSALAGYIVLRVNRRRALGKARAGGAPRHGAAMRAAAPPEAGQSHARVVVLG